MSAGRVPMVFVLTGGELIVCVVEYAVVEGLFVGLFVLIVGVEYLFLVVRRCLVG